MVRLSVVLMLIMGAALAACQPQATPAPPPTGETTPASSAAETEAAAEIEPVETTPAPSDESAEAAAPADAAEGFAATVSTSNGRLRSAPSMDGELLAELALDAPVTVLGRTADTGYYYIRTADGQAGWLARTTVALTDRFADIPVREP